MIRLVLCARDGLGRACLCSGLNRRNEVQLLAVGDALPRLADQVRNARVDVVLVLPDGLDVRSSEIPERIRIRWPEAVVLLGCFDADPGEVQALSSACPEGFFKRVSLTGSIDSVVQQLGGPGLVLHAARDRAAVGGRGLSDREVSVLKHLALGHSSRESAGLLGLSPRTVDGHRRRVSGKLGRAGLAGLTRYAIASGLIDAGSGLSLPCRSEAVECG